MMEFKSPYRIVPNILTIVRMAIATYYPFAPYSLRLPLIMCVLVTHLDGILAVGLNWHSKSGKSMGPIADKLLLLSVALTTYFTSGIEAWKFVLLVSKDIVVLGAGLYLIFNKGVEVLHYIPYRPLGTLTIALQMALFISYLTNGYMNQNLFHIAMTVSCLSAIDYSIRIVKDEFVKMPAEA